MQSFDGMIFATRDTHGEDYPDTLEGKNLPVSHCIKGTSGWALCREVERRLTTPPLDKKSFGCVALGELLASNNKIIPITEVTLIGVCTDICVISNALLLKAFLPETRILVKCLLLCRHLPRSASGGVGSHETVPDRNRKRVILFFRAGL